MSDLAGIFGESVAEQYRRAMVPQRFQPYAARLASLIAGRPDALLRTVDVLEVAAGTGALSRELARVLPHAQVVATDLSEAMLEQARVDEVPSNLTYRQADALDLPFADASVDLVVSQFGAMFFPDKPRAFGEARRVLRPGGELVFLVWDSLASNPAVETVFRTLDELLGPGMTEWISNGPHGYADHAQITADVAAGGLRLDTLTTLSELGPEVTAVEVARAICIGSPARQFIEASSDVTLEQAVDVVTARLAQRYGSGRFREEMSAILVSATRTD